MVLCTLWYQFRLWNMQSEAFRFEQSFEHSPKRWKLFKARARIPPGLFMGLSLCGACFFFFSFCDQILCEKPTCEDRFQILFISWKIQPGASKMLLKWTQKGPTWSQQGPKWSQKGPTLTKRAPKGDQKTLKNSPPGRAQPARGACWDSVTVCV